MWYKFTISFLLQLDRVKYEKKNFGQGHSIEVFTLTEKRRTLGANKSKVNYIKSSLQKPIDRTCAYNEQIKRWWDENHKPEVVTCLHTELIFHNIYNKIQYVQYHGRWTNKMFYDSRLLLSILKMQCQDSILQSSARNENFFSRLSLLYVYWRSTVRLTTSNKEHMP